MFASKTDSKSHLTNRSFTRYAIQYCTSRQAKITNRNVTMVTILNFYSEENNEKIIPNKLVKTLIHVINTLILQNNLRALNNLDGWDKD